MTSCQITELKLMLHWPCPSLWCHPSRWSRIFHHHCEPLWRQWQTGWSQSLWRPVWLSLWSSWETAGQPEDMDNCWVTCTFKMLLYLIGSQSALQCLSSTHSHKTHDRRSYSFTSWAAPIQKNLASLHIFSVGKTASPTCSHSDRLLEAAVQALVFPCLSSRA